MFRLAQSSFIEAALLVGTCSLGACTEAVRIGRDLGAAGSGSNPTAGAGAQPGTAGPELPLAGTGGSTLAPTNAGPEASPDAGPCVPRPCGGSLQACGDCIDNDGDGATDASDPECLGPCDDDESALESGIPVNVTGACRADCYFDLNAGSGDDGCRWSYRCDPVSVGPSYDPTGSAMCEYDPGLASCDGSELDACRTSCLPLTPNGCDCFGCCELPAGSGRFAWLGSRGERPCTPAPGCLNPCDECELCVGKPSLPESCAGALGPSCREGARACDPSNPGSCGRLEYCITGCCVPLPT